MIVYTESKCKDCKYQIIDNVDKKKYSILKLSGTQQRKILQEGKELPDWFTFPLVKQELQENFLPLHKQGFCVYFYGLSGSGKSYISNYLKIKLQEITNRKITLLDCDIIRTHISKGLGFSKEDRSINVQRIGYIASEIVKHNGVCIVSNIAPYADDRKFNKNLISSVGNYIEVLVNTPLEVCEHRDCKGLYHLARKGVLTEFTGISDPFEKYSHEDLEVNGSDTVHHNLELLISYLKNKCLILQY
jgi:sulfate adenylyltransferase